MTGFPVLKWAKRFDERRWAVENDTYITTMLNAGVDLRDVQKSPPTTSTRTTMRYDRARTTSSRPDGCWSGEPAGWVSRLRLVRNELLWDFGEVVDCREVSADLRGFGDAELVVESVGLKPVRTCLVCVGEQVVGVADTRVGASQLGAIADGVRVIVRLLMGAKSLDRISGSARGFP